MKSNLLVFFCLLFFLPIVYGQANFRRDLEASNPVSPKSNLSLEEKLEIHQDFLNDAIQEKDQQKELFANLHIFLDYIRMEKFTEAARYLFESENIAKESGNPSWEGWVTYRSGLLYIRIEQEDKAIENYKKALELCGLSGDSLCIGESLEQLGALTGRLDSYEEAEDYFSRAMPILKKYGTQKSKAAILLNYGSLIAMKGDPAKAIPLLEEAIEINFELKKYRSAGKVMNNLAYTYSRLGQIEKAIEQYEEAIELNTKHGFSQNLIRNYLGLHIVYDRKKEYKKAMDLFIKRVELKDSLVGQETQLRIADIEAKYENKSRELELEKTQSKLLSTKRSLEKTIGISLLTLLLLGFGLWYFRSKTQQAKNQKEEAEKSLKQLTKLLIDKNSAILSLNTQLTLLSNQKESKVVAEDLKSFVNMTILTAEEWGSYKSNFEKIYPGYLRKLRLDYSSLSDAEERLFLLIKFQLKTGEIAAILGISIDSVKKTRQRLRKRLQLDKDLSLDGFISNY